MALTAAQIDKQRKEAEELLFSGPQTLGLRQGSVLRPFQRPAAVPVSHAEP